MEVDIANVLQVLDDLEKHCKEKERLYRHQKDRAQSYSNEKYLAGKSRGYDELREHIRGIRDSYRKNQTIDS